MINWLVKATAQAIFLLPVYKVRMASGFLLDKPAATILHKNKLL